MKKSLIIVLSLFFILGLAVPVVVHAANETPAVAKGDTKITLGGDIRIRGFFETNKDFDSDKGDNYSTYETRVRLRVHAQVTPNTEGMIEFRDTKSDGDDDMTWGSTGGDSKGLYTRGGNVSGYTDARYTQFTQAWIQHKGSGLLGIPAGIKIGHMPLQLGNGLFYSHTKSGDDAIVLLMNPTKELSLGLAIVKFYEGASTSLNDDANGYAGFFTYKVSEVNMGGDATYIDDQDNGAAAGTQPLHFWNVGLRGDTKVAGLGIKADVELQSGKLKDTTDIKYRGYAVLIGADYAIDPLTVGLEYAYGSGNKSETTNKYEGFANLLDNTQKYSFVAEYRVPAGSGVAQEGLNNTQYVRARVGAKPIKDLSGHLDIYWLRANKVSGFTYKEKDLGWEIDCFAKYKIDKNLTYFVEGGYLFAGDFYRQYTTGEPDNPWAVRHGVTLSF